VALVSKNNGKQIGKLTIMLSDFGVGLLTDKASCSNPSSYSSASERVKDAKEPVAAYVCLQTHLASLFPCLLVTPRTAITCLS